MAQERWLPLVGPRRGEEPGIWGGSGTHPPLEIKHIWGSRTPAPLAEPGPVNSLVRTPGSAHHRDTGTLRPQVPQAQRAPLSNRDADTRAQNRSEPALPGVQHETGSLLS